ncbi:MAG: hypothetical protein V4627_08090 [Pseudomonadota bacterium]
MFSFFKRPDKENSVTSARPPVDKRKSVRQYGPELREPPPLPQVIEGNEDSDWAMWKDSVLEQDSQMHSQFHDTVPSEFPMEQHAESSPDADPFAKVGKHGA